MATCDNTLVWRLLLTSASEHLPHYMISSNKAAVSVNCVSRKASRLAYQKPHLRIPR
uniref:Uncharacterized protein n=1 Tax=Brassica oleracea TaxID=3712 RepID=A0A3P6CPJ7_BRAOL|nr:unnamed protein product [Brassica oleracea]